MNWDTEESLTEGGPWHFLWDRTSIRNTFLLERNTRRHALHGDDRQRRNDDGHCTGDFLGKAELLRPPLRKTADIS
jgi:hypothetical protein